MTGVTESCTEAATSQHSLVAGGGVVFFGRGCGWGLLAVVAEKCGLSHPTVKSIASGNEKISLNTWKKLSDYLSDSQ